MLYSHSWDFVLNAICQMITSLLWKNGNIKTEMFLPIKLISENNGRDMWPRTSPSLWMGGRPRFETQVRPPQLAWLLRKLR